MDTQSFKVLVLLHAAQADYEFHKNERKYLTQLFNEDSVDVAAKIYEDKKIESFSYILRHFKEHFPDSSSIQSLKEEMRELFLADGKFCDFEVAFEKFFESLSV